MAAEAGTWHGENKGTPIRGAWRALFDEEVRAWGPSGRVRGRFISTRADSWSRHGFSASLR